MSARSSLFLAAALCLASAAAHGAPRPNPVRPDPVRPGPQWSARDSAEAAALLQAFTQSPRKVDSLAAGPGSFGREHDLGFGYRMREVWVNPAGKLGFSLKILYENRSPFSFELRPVINYSALRARCLPLLRPVFGDSLQPYYWNLEAACAPLGADSLQAAGGESPPPEIRKALGFYMSPYSGILYGVRGGEAGQILENRDRFLGLAEILVPDKGRARWLLRSLNPASRLTAAEFIVRHKSDFHDYDALLQGPLAFVFAHPAKAATLRGANAVEEDARKLVFEYAKKEVLRDGRGVLRLY